MTIEKQKTFGAVVGMEATVPVKPDPDTLIECSDDTMIRRGDARYDCRGGVHRTDSDAHDANVTIVTEVLDGVDEWVTEYSTENTDYADGYAHIIDELSHLWPDLVNEWLCDNYEFESETDDKLVKLICEALDGGFDCEPEYNRSEYATYSGSGCCLWGTDIGECEEQIDISNHDELQALHDEGILDDILDDVNCDAYVSRSHRRVLNKKTGNYKNVGRETYMPYDHDSDYPCLTTYHNPGGRWDWVVSYDRMKELATAAIIELARTTDTKAA